MTFNSILSSIGQAVADVAGWVGAIGRVTLAVVGKVLGNFGARLAVALSVGGAAIPLMNAGVQRGATSLAGAVAAARDIHADALAAKNELAYAYMVANLNYVIPLDEMVGMMVVLLGLGVACALYRWLGKYADGMMRMVTLAHI